MKYTRMSLIAAGALICNLAMAQPETAVLVVAALAATYYRYQASNR